MLAAFRYCCWLQVTPLRVKTYAAPALVTSRQRAALERALNHLREAIAAKEFGAPHDLLAIDVRAAMRAIGEVTGESIDESVLTEIFSRFCIGK